MGRGRALIGLTLFLSVVGLALSGCAVYAPPPAYAYGTPYSYDPYGYYPYAYYGPAYGYYGPPFYGSVDLFFGGWEGHHRR